jgi:ATP-dependent DNA ligase
MAAFVETTSRPPRWIKPQLTRLADEAPAGSEWLHEIKYDGYRMLARIDGDKIQLLTRTGLDSCWAVEVATHKHSGRSQHQRRSAWRDRINRRFTTAP